MHTARACRTHTGAVPGDLITVTDPTTGRANFTNPDPTKETTMTTAITERDEAAEVTLNRYRYIRVVETGGRIVRARIERDFYHDQSLAVAEVLNDQMTWTCLVKDAPGNWWHATQTPRPHVDAAAVLGPLADRILHRAAEVLAPPPTPPTVSAHVLDAVSALLATTYGYDGELRITPEDITWASIHGGTLHVIEHADGSVTFTKQHRDQCPFVTSAGILDCDDECYFEHPADMERRLGT